MVKGVWVKLNTWVRHYPLPAYIVLVLVAAYSLSVVQTSADDAQDAVKTSNQEREARVKVSAEINRYVCGENNKQDRILASLVEASLGDGGTFGAGLDVAQLSSFDKEVLRSIAKIQSLGESGNEGLKQVFERALSQLRRETPCAELISAFKEASDTQDYKAIRELLRSIDKADRQASK